MKNLKSICAKLESQGWSTTIPKKWDDWKATAWPPTENGEPTDASELLHDRFMARGILGKWKRDAENDISCDILVADEE